MNAPVPTYVTEQFTDDERSVLRRYFSNLDGPVFALVNLPEVVKGALFARYSRSAKSLRRLFLDEFVGDLDITDDESADATVGVERAEQLYDRVFFEYGDDSVAQLGGVHLACEQASNLLTKVLEWGRLMSYLEQSTRYIPYDERLGGRYRYHRDPEVLASNLGARYVGDMDRLFDTYGELARTLQDHFRERHPKSEQDSDFVYRQAIRAKALDATRGILPAASLSNVGIYGSGQGFESLLLRMRAHPLPEARQYAELMLVELRKVVPSFLRRVDLPDRGQATSEYMASNRRAMETTAYELLAGDEVTAPSAPTVTLVDWDPEGEVKAIAAMLYPYTGLAETQLLDRVRQMSTDDRISIVRSYVGERSNRRHKPGRALERTDYRVPRPATPPPDDHRVAGAHPPTRLHAAGRHRRSRSVRTLRRGDGDVGQPVERPRGALPRASCLCGVAGLSDPLRHAVQRPRGHAPDRAPHVGPGPSQLPLRRPGDAPAHRRTGRSSSHRRDDDLRRPQRRPRPRTSPGRATRRGA